MKGYIAILLLILLTSCVPKVEVDTAKPVETPISQKPEVSEGLETKSQSEEPKETIEEQEEVIEETIEETSPEENIIEIKEDSFYPKEKTIEINTEIEWIKKDKRIYKIACYLEGNRITLSPDLKQDDSFTYTFLKEGEYTCITFPYGLRNIINVEAKEALLSPTGSAVISEGKGTKASPFAAIALLAIIILLFFIFGRKR